MKTTYRNALCLGTFLSFALMSGVPTAHAAIGTCPATAFNGVSFAGASNTVTGLAINDECTAVYTARSTGVVEVRSFAGATAGTITVASPVGLDTSIDGTVLYVATSTGLAIVNLNDPATWAAPPQVTPPLNVGRRAQYVAATGNSSVFIASDGTTGSIQLLQYDPIANTFRNRTGEIPGGIASAVLKTNADRTRVNGIVSASGQAYAYDRATDTFVTSTATTTVATDGTVSTLNNAGNLRYSVNPSSVAGRSTLAVTNVRTGAVIARFTINESVAVSLPNALTISADGSQAAVITASGFQLVDIAPAVTLRTMMVSTLYAPSYLRFHNSGAVAGTVRVTLRDAFTAGVFPAWTSPSIPAGAELQFAVADIEAALNITAANKPFRYYAEIEAPAGFFGYMQNVIWNQTTGTLSNISSCDRDIQSTGALDVALIANDSAQISGVHSSALAAYPAQVHIASTSTAAQSVVIDVYNANTGALLGTYTSGSIAAGNQLTVAVSDIEVAAGISASTSTPHYVMIARPPFQGFLQHRLINSSTGTVADMSAACVINGELQTREGASSIVGGATNTVQLSSIYSTSQTTTQSFLRFSNESNAAQTATVSLTVPEGTRLWTSPAIPAGGEIQVSMATIESEVPTFTKPAFYSATVTMAFDGSVQHVVYRPSTATFTNLSTCVGEGSDDLTKISGVHSSLLTDFPSYIVVSNNLAFSAALTIAVNDARTGVRLGTLVLPSINGKANNIFTAEAIENGLGITPAPGQFHYNIVGQIGELNGVQANFHLQHLVLNKTTNTLEDMTKTCRPN